jgi:hypothetical protein
MDTSRKSPTREIEKDYTCKRIQASNQALLFAKYLKGWEICCRFEKSFILLKNRPLKVENYVKARLWLSFT